MPFDPYSAETAGYHLFFMPTGALKEKLKETIQQLAAEYDGPVFEPHVTLVARIPGTDESELIEKTKALAGMHPFALTFGELRSEDAYFRALYVEMMEQQMLQTLHQQASAIFDMEPSPAYKGHLSLLYGNYPEEQKARTLESLVPPQESFVASSIHLFKTPGAPETWSEIVNVPLGE